MVLSVVRVIQNVREQIITNHVLFEEELNVNTFRSER